VGDESGGSMYGNLEVESLTWRLLKLKISGTFASGCRINREVEFE
jgi:hypothetical protein